MRHFAIHIAAAILLTASPLVADTHVLLDFDRNGSCAGYRFSGDPYPHWGFDSVTSVAFMPLDSTCTKIGASPDPGADMKAASEVAISGAFRPPWNPATLGIQSVAGKPAQMIAVFARPVRYVYLQLGDWGGDADLIFLEAFDFYDPFIGPVGSRGYTEFLRPAGSTELNSLLLLSSNRSYTADSVSRLKGGIGAVRFGTKTVGDGYIALDNMGYAVPLPGGLVLLLTGLAGMTALRRRR